MPKPPPSSLFLWRCVNCRWPCSKKFTCMVLITALLTLIALFIPTLRNMLLHPVWPKPWREMSTLEVISIKFASENSEEVYTNDCFMMTQPDVLESDIDRTKFMFYSHVYTTELQAVEHQRFFPVLRDDEKMRLLHAYLVVDSRLQKAGVEFFLVEGSLLGVHRHHGMVPWDDDIDIAISVVHRGTVSKLLGCIQGFRLVVSHVGHWKFFSNSSQHHYPFVDIFFYDENENYVWAVTDYLRQTVIFPKKHTFPLTTATWEGLVVPVPKDINYILRSVFDFEMCQSPSYNHKTSQSIAESEMSKIKCSSLAYLYVMFNLKY
ncbi:hypothetical protein BsWGS_18359 [Bradybaena similaris]